jgi:hypothetical protein
MCGRVRLASDYSEIKIRLKFAPNSVAPNFEPDWNKPPTAPMLVAIRSVNGERVPKMMKWGLVPHWAKDDKLQFSTFNARAEEFTTKPAFRTKNQATSQCSLQSARLVLTEQLRSGSPARFILEIDIRKLLAAVVPHHEAGRLLLDRPGWREAASDH